MAETSIEWATHSWNPTTGCDRVSPGCGTGGGADCYALTMARRLKAMGNPRYQVDGDAHTSGPGFGLTLHADKIEEPLTWRGDPRRVFVNSMSDLFHQEVPDEFLAEVFGVMATAREHTFQILTKRPQRMATLLSDEAFVAQVEVAILAKHPRAPLTDDGEDYLIPGVWDEDGMAWPLPNVWLGVSIETNAYAFRADHLRATPAAVRWVSAEPLLGPLDKLDLTGVDWLVAGGQSGPSARPMHPAWVRDLRDRCFLMLVPFFFKQWGAWGPAGCGPGPDHHLTIDGRLFESGRRLGPSHMCQPVAIRRWGKKDAGRVLDGRTHDEFPEVVV